MQGLINRLNGTIQGNRWNFFHGLKVQAERTLEAFRAGLLQDIEVTIGNGRIDMLMKPLASGIQWAVECKNWTGWDLWSAALKEEMKRKLRSQIRSYLNNSTYYIRVEFKNSIPPEILQLLQGLPEYGTRLLVFAV